MIEIKEVKTRQDIKDFIELPLSLYKDCEQFVPPLYSDEKKLIKNGGKPDISDSIFLLAKKDGRVVGRIQGIIQHQHNEKEGERGMRFTRFDSVNDTEVSRALFSALERWGRERGMEKMCGPLGYSDLDREGLLIDGFSERQTFEEQYNYDYYAALIEDAGYEKDIDWFEFELRAPEKRNEMLKRVAARSLELNKLHIADSSKMSKRAYIDKYKDGLFALIDECYSKLYGTVPISEEMQKELVSQFMMILNKEYLIVIVDESDKPVAFALCFPSMGDAFKKSGGRLTPSALIKLMKLVKAPKVIDLGLVAVHPDYQSAGVNAVILDKLLDYLCSGKIELAETNLNLETNTQVMAQWKHFSARLHKRRRSYKKSL